MTIALYLLTVYLLGRWELTWATDAPPNVEDERMSWLAFLHPFLSLDVALNRFQAPDYSLVASRGTLAAYALAYPSATYITWTLLLSILMVTASMFFVRSESRKGEPGVFAKLLKRTESAGERRRKPRHVWSNPVAWREAKTKSSAAGGVTRWALIIGGCAASMTVLFYHLTDSTALPAQQAQAWLGAVLMIVFALTVLLAANAAATSLTKEKESKSMEVLLTTPLTSRYIIWGKLRGLVSFALPLLSVPVVTMVLFGMVSLLRGGPQPLAWIETAIELGLLLTMFIAGCCVVCLSFSLKSKKTVRASINSMATLVIITAILTAVSFAFVDSGGGIGAFMAPLSPVTAIYVATKPVVLTDNSFQQLANHAASLRVTLLIGSVFFSCGYAIVILSYYKTLVRNFDMIVRKQSAA
ncbi:MAG: ABC transporter permease subunit [Gemmatimonadaceae bacterium]